jgi:hypothetical protein
MKTIEIIAKRVAISPPNSELLVTLNAPFEEGTKTRYTGNWDSKTPLMTPTDFSAEYVKSGNIEVEVTVYINASLDINQLEIYGGLDLVAFEKGDSFQKLYVTYDQSENKPINVYPYTLSFEIPGLLNNQSIPALNICLWNEDPKTSRGTVTTVKSGVGH